MRRTPVTVPATTGATAAYPTPTKSGGSNQEPSPLTPWLKLKGPNTFYPSNTPSTSADENDVEDTLQAQSNADPNLGTLTPQLEDAVPLFGRYAASNSNPNHDEEILQSTNSTEFVAEMGRRSTRTRKRQDSCGARTSICKTQFTLGMRSAALVSLRRQRPPSMIMAHFFQTRHPSLSSLDQGPTRRATWTKLSAGDNA